MEKKSTNRKTKDRSVMKKIVDSMLVFFGKELRKKTLVLIIISVVIYLSSMIFFMNIANNMENIQDLSMVSGSFYELLKQKVILILLVILAGLVPYFHISVIAYIGYVMTIASDVATYGVEKGNFTAILANIIPVVLDITVISFITAVGIYMCKMFTKKFRYSQRSSFGFSDVRLQIYEMRKQTEKGEKLKKEKEEKVKRMEKNNVKVNYIQIMYYIILAVVIESIVVFIQTIIM